MFFKRHHHGANITKKHKCKCPRPAGVKKSAPAPSGTGAPRATLESRKLEIRAVTDERSVPQECAHTTAHGHAVLDENIPFPRANRRDVRCCSCHFPISTRIKALEMKANSRPVDCQWPPGNLSRGKAGTGLQRRVRADPPARIATDSSPGRLWPISHEALPVQAEHGIALVRLVALLECISAVALRPRDDRQCRAAEAPGSAVVLL